MVSTPNLGSRGFGVAPRGRKAVAWGYFENNQLLIPSIHDTITGVYLWALKTLYHVNTPLDHLDSSQLSTALELRGFYDGINTRVSMVQIEEVPR